MGAAGTAAIGGSPCHPLPSCYWKISLSHFLSAFEVNFWWLYHLSDGVLCMLVSSLIVRSVLALGTSEFF